MHCGIDYTRLIFEGRGGHIVNSAENIKFTTPLCILITAETLATIWTIQVHHVHTVLPFSWRACWRSKQRNAWSRPTSCINVDCWFCKDASIHFVVLLANGKKGLLTVGAVGAHGQDDLRVDASRSSPWACVHGLAKLQRPSNLRARYDFWLPVKHMKNINWR